LSPQSEPEIYAATNRFGTVLENVVIESDSRQLDLDDDSITENTRAAYPLQFIPNMVETARGRHPSHVIMLTCDAFGVMPPIARLSSEQVMYYFLSGYTAKVAGTEKGMGSEPSATFSTCFGAPFLVHHPAVYSDLLSKKIGEFGSSCWLVNTGWSGGPFGAGARIKIAHSRAMVSAVLSGRLDAAEFRKDPVFGLDVPAACPDVPSAILNPRNTWQDKAAYDAKARTLAGLFKENFKAFESDVPATVRGAGPA
jgi:phosphoenolpyruvate carboxykinase (ATP)